MERLSKESFYTGYVFAGPRDEDRNIYGYRTIYFGKNMMPWLLLDCDEEAGLCCCGCSEGGGLALS